MMKLTKGVKEIREFLPREQLELVEKMRQIQDPKSVEMLVQFVSLIQNGRPGKKSIDFTNDCNKVPFSKIYLRYDITLDL